MSSEFWFLAVFEASRPVDVRQADTGQRITQATTQKWSRAGTLNINPGQPTEDVVQQVVDTCRAGGGIPVDALLVDINILPGQLVPPQ